MIRLARLSIAHPVRALLAWAAIALALALVGLGVSNSLSPSIVVVPEATPPARNISPTPNSVRASSCRSCSRDRGTLDRQGPILVRRLAPSGTSASCPPGTAAAQVRSSARRGAATIVAAVARTEEAMVDGRQAEIDSIVDKTVSGPVRAHVTGSRPSTSR